MVPKNLFTGHQWRKTSLVAQTVIRLSTMWETQVRFLGREDPLEKEAKSSKLSFSPFVQNKFCC